MLQFMPHGSAHSQKLAILLKRYSDKLAASANLRLGEYTLEGALDRTFGKVHAQSNFLVGLALDQETKDIQLPPAEGVSVGRRC